MHTMVLKRAWELFLSHAEAWRSLLLPDWHELLVCLVQARLQQHSGHRGGDGRRRDAMAMKVVTGLQGHFLSCSTGEGPACSD